MSEYFFSDNPPITVFENWQIRKGLKRYLRPKDLAIKNKLLSLNYPQAKNILDFGCANGVWLERILKDTKARGFGVDVSDSLIDVANSRKNRLGKYFSSDKNWSIKNNSIDLCFSFDVFEHLRDRKKEMVRLSKSIKKGGKLLIFTLNPDNKYTFDWLFEVFGSKWLYERSDHVKSRFVSPQKLGRELIKNGFTKFDYELYPGPFNLFYDVFCYLSLMFIEKILPKKINYFLDLNSKFVEFIYKKNLFFDKFVNNRGHSNGYFIWAEK